MLHQRSTGRALAPAAHRRAELLHLSGCAASRPHISPPLTPALRTPSLSHTQQDTQLNSRRRTASGCHAASVAAPSEQEVYPGVYEGTWTWQGHRIRYQHSGSSSSGETLVLVHGFGGNADHWRKNTSDLAAYGYRVFAIDLLGYGYSDKPSPLLAPQNTIYCFPNWGQQLCSFMTEVAGAPGYIITNSVGGLAGLEASIARPDLVKGVQLINISLRGLHVKRTNPLLLPFVAAFQRVLRETQLGKAFFGSVAKPETVRTILREAYGDKEAVTPELVDKILAPGLLPGAVDVFLDFISYSGGPLPEELLDQTTVPVSILWGDKDPWENVHLARDLFAQRPTVVEFITLPGAGHCPQDEAPHLVNPLVDKFVRASAAAAAAVVVVA